MGKISALAAALTLTLAVSSCSSSGSDDADPPAPSAAAASITADQLVDDLAGVGIATYAEAGDSAPEKLVDGAGVTALTGWQVENMTRQLNDGRGYVGRDLDTLVGADVPISVVLAAYVKAGDTPSAELARTLMGDRDWEHSALDIVYPDAVVTLFLNDLASEGGGASPAADIGALVVQPVAALKTGLCSQLSDFLASGLESIVNGLQIDASGGGVGGVLATIWNTVVEIAASAAQLALEALTAPVVAVIKGAVSILAVLSSASSVLDPWTVQVTADKDPTSYGVAPEPGKDVTVTAHVKSAIDFSWPEDVKDCASVAGVDLPDPGSAKDSPVTWQVQNPGVVTVGDEDTVIDASGDAHLHLTTLTESQQDHDKGAFTTSYVGVSVDVKRLGVEKLMNLLTNLVIGALPDAVKGIVQALIGPLKSATSEQLQKLVLASGKMSELEVQHHGPAAPDAETPTPSDSATDCAVVDGVTEVPDGTFEGPLELDVNGKGQSANVSVDSSGNGDMTIEVKGGKVTGGSWTMDWSSEGGGSEGGATVKINLTGKIGGPMKGTAAAPVAVGHWSVHGKADVTALGIKQQVPLDQTGGTSSTLTIESTTCDDVTATFIPDFNSKTQGVAVISGVARWSGTRVG